MRQRLARACLASILIAAPLAIRAAECGCGLASCTDPGCCQPCVPACKATWDEATSKKPKYSMKCGYACARDRDCWCADPAECRCEPPCGRVIVKKKIYKEDGPEKAEKIPKYEVVMVPAEPCDCVRCSGVCWWNPLAVLHHILHH